MRLEYEVDCLLFDLDGTLVDSSGSVRRAWMTWCARHGVEPERVFAISEGRQASATVRDLAPHLDPVAEDAWMTRLQLEDMEGVVEIPGARALLEGLEPGAWAIVTSCPHDLAEARLRAAGLPRPGLLIGAEDVEHSKPAPDGFLLGASGLGFTPDRGMAFEDSEAGLASAIGAGTRPVCMGRVTKAVVPEGVPTIRSWHELSIEPLASGMRVALRPEA